jgi:hypothetical protein
MKNFKSAAAVALTLGCFGIGGCFYVNSSTVSTSPAKGGTPISASASDWGVLYLSAPQGLTSTANSQLMNSCQSGRVSNVSTELDLRDFFVAQQYTVSAYGNCQ